MEGLQRVWSTISVYAANVLIHSGLWSALARIVVFYALAWIVHALSRRISRRAVSLSRMAPRQRRPGSQRRKTLEHLFSSAISVVVFVAATTRRSGTVP